MQHDTSFGHYLLFVDVSVDVVHGQLVGVPVLANLGDYGIHMVHHELGQKDFSR